MLEPHAMLNAFSPADARAALTRCCGASRWVEAMLARRPFASAAALFADAEASWSTMGREDFLEAFSHHPRIGARASNDAWASQEQARVAEAGAEIRQALLAANEEYERRFGYTFIVCATGKSAGEMLALLRARLPNNPTRELGVAAAEQARITRLRLEKLAS